jgi:hypothetical protein
VITDINSPFLSVSEAAQYVRLKKRTLDKMRCSGAGPYFRKHGGRVFYEINELAEWSLSRKSKSTAGYWYQQRKESANAGPAFP